jgi:hypothetical protein
MRKESTMTWTTFHRRGEVLREIIAAIDSRSDGLLPMDLPGVSETFDDELTVLGALQLRWHTRLAGRIERELMVAPHDPEAAVDAAWRATTRELPGVRAVLDHYRDHPVDERMARATAVAARKERALVGRVPDAAA